MSDWAGGMPAGLAADHGSKCPLAHSMEGHIIHCGTISSLQSDATSEMVKHFWSQL